MKKNLFLTFLLACCLFTQVVSADITYTLDESYGQVPLTFVLNEGQFDASIEFAAEGSNPGQDEFEHGVVYLMSPEASVPAGELYTPVNLAVVFLATNQVTEVSGHNRVSWNNNYFIGSDPDNWHTDVPNYQTVVVHNLYDGIDLQYSSAGRRICYDLIVQPGSDPSQLSMQPRWYEDTKGLYMLELNDDGDLVYFQWEIPWGGYEIITVSPPYCYQIIEDEEVKIDVRFRWVDEEMRIVAFEFGDYNPGYDLILKPEMISTPFMSRKFTNGVSCIDVDDEGSAYVAGHADFIGYGKSLRCCFVLKLNETGDGLGYATYYKGSSLYSPPIEAIKVDRDSNIYIVGDTSDNTFPTTPGTYINEFDVEKAMIYLMKLNPAGNSLIYSTFFGGKSPLFRTHNYVGGIDVSEDGNVYLTGWTYSSDFPTTPGVFKTDFTHDTRNGFVTKFNKEGSDLIFSTFVDLVGFNNIKLDNNNNICVTSTKNNDLFILKLKSDGSDTLFTKIIGGSGSEAISDFLLDSNGNIILVGSTNSEDFPVTEDAYDTDYNGGEEDLFVIKINSDGSNIIFSTFIGGDEYEYSPRICIDKWGDLYIMGYTLSSNFPSTPDAFDMDFIGSWDMVLFKLHNSGNTLLYSTFIGSPQSDICDGGFFIDEIGNVFIAGRTQASNFLINGGIFDTGNIYHHDTPFIIKLNNYQSTIVENNNSTTETMLIFNSYPNPFNSITTISFLLPYSTHVDLTIYNVHGQVIGKLVDDFLGSGMHNILFEGYNLPSGIYFYRLNACNSLKVGKIILLK